MEKTILLFQLMPAGILVTEAGGTFVEHEGPHAFFLDDPAATDKKTSMTLCEGRFNGLP